MRTVAHSPNLGKSLSPQPRAQWLASLSLPEFDTDSSAVQSMRKEEEMMDLGAV